MSEQKVRNGSFRVKLPIGNESSIIAFDSAYSMFPTDYEQKDVVTCTVPMLSQNEYANGWRQVVQKKRFFFKRFKDDNMMEHSKLCTNAFRLNVNLAQLPLHLWPRIKTRQNNSIVSEGIYQYIIEHTDVDNEIKELVSHINQPYRTSRERVNALLSMMKDNDIYGWVTIKASAIYQH